MAKGQQRSNREIRKPKKTAAPAASPSAKGMAPMPGNAKKKA